MNGLKDAIKSRRMGANPMPSQSTPMQAQMGQEQQAPKAEDVLAMLPDEEKMKLFEMLKKDMAGESDEGMSPEAAEGDDNNESKMEDGAGQLKSTPGEKQALEGQMNMDVAESLSDSRFKGDEDMKPRNLSERVKMNIAKVMKKRG